MNDKSDLSWREDTNISHKYVFNFLLTQRDTDESDSETPVKKLIRRRKLRKHVEVKYELEDEAGTLPASQGQKATVTAEVRIWFSACYSSSQVVHSDKCSVVLYFWIYSSYPSK